MASYGSTAFTYDGLGRRLSKQESGKKAIMYTYDSNGRVVKQSNGIECIYDNAGVAGLVYNSTTYLYRKDAQGNIVVHIDSNRHVMVEYKYDSWGSHAVSGAKRGRHGICNAYRASKSVPLSWVLL